MNTPQPAGRSCLSAVALRVVRGVATLAVLYASSIGLSGCVRPWAESRIKIEADREVFVRRTLLSSSVAVYSVPPLSQGSGPTLWILPITSMAKHWGARPRKTESVQGTCVGLWGPAMVSWWQVDVTTGVVAEARPVLAVGRWLVPIWPKWWLVFDLLATMAACEVGARACGRMRRRYLRRHQRCPGCGYALGALAQCPECGMSADVGDGQD